MAQRDNRLYAQFTLDYADSAKIAPLSDAAFRAHVRMILWSRRMLTDGRVPVPMAKVFAKPRILDELLRNDPTCPSLSLVGDDYVLHDFLEHQSSRAEVEAQSKRNSANGRSGGLARAKRVASKSPSETQATSNTETETETSTSKEVEKEARKRATRLSPDWKPSPESIQKIQSDAPHVDARTEHATFVDYWIAQPGQKGVKTDWDATWRNWMRRKEGDWGQSRARDKPSKREQIDDVLDMGRRMQEQQDRKEIGA